jgi:plasmid stabilization system protein ParE
VPIRLLESAKEDLREGWRFYEQNHIGLGDYFLACIQADVRSLTIYAGVHEMADGFHRLLSKRFPFAIYYLLEPASVDVYAILDCRRDPQWISQRLASSRPGK